jgi:hypothetical protein
MGVTEMLIVATAAFPEEGAERLDPPRGALHDLLQHGFGKIFFLPRDLHPYPVPRSCERDKNNFPVDPPHSVATINHFLNFQDERTTHLLSATENPEDTEIQRH